MAPAASGGGRAGRGLVPRLEHRRRLRCELNQAGAAGYRFAGTQGGETAFGGREAVVVMELDPDGRSYRYILLATSRTGTLQREELNEVPSEFDLA